MPVLSDALRWRDVWNLYCRDFDVAALANCQWLDRVDPLSLVANATPVEFSDRLAEAFVEHTSAGQRKEQGQFFSPPPIARYMAGLAGKVGENWQVLEPSAGTGVLIAALAERVAQEGRTTHWAVTAYETDPTLRALLTMALGFARQYLAERGIHLVFNIQANDFILAHAAAFRPAPLLEPIDSAPRYHLAIANPPYFKLPKSDPRVEILSEVVYGQPNIYALFMAVAAKSLWPVGRMVFITPRSFCSGRYFQRFRRWLLGRVHLEQIHLFDSRKEAFERDKVLQENIILVARSGQAQSSHGVLISVSRGIADLDSASTRRVPAREVYDPASPEAMICIPRSNADSLVRAIMDQWTARLSTYGMEISTGPVVPFRTSSLLRNTTGRIAAPLLWVQNVERMRITWPQARLTKLQHLAVEPATASLLVRDSNYVLVRRFSAKEDNGRITAAPYLKGSLEGDYLGIENHVNYIHRPGGELSEAEAGGLAAYLNSRLVEQFFRQYSGNTQVSAAELRDLPLPPLAKLTAIGRRIMEADSVSRVAMMNTAVAEELELPPGLWADDPSGGHMTKIEEAKDLLRSLGLPPQQRNEIAALTLLALANLTEQTSWNRAEKRSITIHNIIGFIETHYGKRYAENTRETFRRQVLHQFEQARIADRNPDDPTLPTNSPRTHYALSEAILPVVRKYGTRAGRTALEHFKAQQGTLLDLYQQTRQKHLVSFKDTAGREYRLSPGKHNRLQVAVVEEFAPRFAPGAKLLYMGDAANKTLIMDEPQLRAVGYPANRHAKLPDVVLYLRKHNRLYLVEVITSHGPVSPKRRKELEALLSKAKAELIFVSAFPDFKEFKRHLANIAWETEVWIQEIPDHLVHFNGDKFLGRGAPPGRRSKKG